MRPVHGYCGWEFCRQVFTHVCTQLFGHLPLRWPLSSLLSQAIIHPFLSKKMKERIRAFGSDYSALHQLVDPSVLPPDCGGTSTDDGWDWFESLMQDELKDGQEAQNR